jgi:hypothetical protein
MALGWWRPLGEVRLCLSAHRFEKVSCASCIRGSILIQCSVMSTGSENEMENAAIVLETIRAVEERDAAKLFNLYHEDV